jgi:hypothetical protein
VAFQGLPDGDTIQPVKRILVWLILAAVLVTIFAHTAPSKAASMSHLTLSTKSIGRNSGEGR